MSHLPYHPAPGFGDLMPGSFVVPQNPIHPDGTPLVPSVQAQSGGNIAYRPKIGDLLPGAFVVPQNPIRRNLASNMGMGCTSCGDSGYDGSGFHSNGLQGLGMDLSAQGLTTWATSDGPMGLPMLAWVGIAVGAYLLISPGGSDYRAARRDLDSQHRGYRRAARRIA